MSVISELMRRLDYLETLGVDVLWLVPFQPSTNLDNSEIHQTRIIAG